MGKVFKIGQRVGFNSEAGHVKGTITGVHTKPFKVNGYTRHASKDDPQYSIKSNISNHVAHHFPDALHKLTNKNNRMKKKKYQFAGATNQCGEGLLWDANSMQCVPQPTDPNRVMPPTIDYSGDSTNFDNSKIVPLQRNEMQSDGDLTYHPLFKLFNTLAQLTTGVANQATNMGIDKRQRLQNTEAFQNPNYSPANQDGLDKSPIYAKYGIHIKPSHVGKFTALKKRTGKSTEELKHSSNPTVRKEAVFAANAKHFQHKAGGKHKHIKDTDKDGDSMMDKDMDMMQTGGYVQPQTMREWNSFLDFAKQKGVAGSPELDVRNKNLGQQTLNEYLQQNPNSTLTYDSIPKIQQELQTYRQQVLGDVKANKRGFAPGTTESNFMSGLSAVDGWLGSKTSTYKFPEAYMNHISPSSNSTEDLGLAATAQYQAGGNGQKVLSYKDKISMLKTSIPKGKGYDDNAYDQAIDAVALGKIGDLKKFVDSYDPRYYETADNDQVQTANNFNTNILNAYNDVYAKMKQLAPEGTETMQYDSNPITLPPDTKRQAGGDSQSQQLGQQVAAMLQQGAQPKEVIQKLIKSGVPQDKAMQLVQGVIQELQQQQQQGQQGGQQQPPVNQAGGDDTPVDDNDGQQAELEEGENYQTQQGDINKVPEGAGTHEEGGVQVPDVARVLEDTSDKRKDSASKLLKIQPKVVEGLLGFKPKTSLSHSKAHEKAIEFYNKKSAAITNKIKNNVDSRDTNDNDPYALNSMKFNVTNLSQMPSENDMFNALFDHQEGVKSLFGIDDNGKKGQYGLKPMLNNDVDPVLSYGFDKNIPVKGQYGLNAYQGDKNYKGNASKYSTDQWDSMAKDLGFQGQGDRGFQEFLFNQNGDVGKLNLQKGVINLHNEYGDPNTPPPVTSPYNWFDNRLGHRWDSAYEAWQSSKQPSAPNGSSNGTEEDYTTNTTPPSSSDPNINVASNANDQSSSISPNNSFNVPLKWYDVAGPIQALLGATKANLNYNPATVKQIRLKGVNPLPTLQQGQSDFNAELNALASTGVNGGAEVGNIGNIYAKKYALNNQVLGNAENANAAIKNQETEYNANAADRQSQSDQNSRATFENHNLASDEAVRQQKLTAADSLYTRIAQNKKFNLEGNLLMHLFPNFNPSGDYNGKQYSFRNPISMGANSNGNLDLNKMLESSGIDPSSLTPKDRAKYIVQLGKYNARRQLLLNKK